MKNTQLSLIFTVTIVVLTILAITGCDEGMNMAGPVVMGPGEEPDENPNENKAPGSEQPKPETPETLAPEPKPDPQTPAPPEPTITIGTVAQADDGSVTVSGTSTDLSAGETVTITLGDTVTVTATTDNTGAWSVTVPATEAATLAAGATAVRAAAGTATGTNSFEHTVPEEVPSHGIVVSTEEEQIMLDIIIDVFGYSEDLIKKHQEAFEKQYNAYKAQYGVVFEVGAEISAATAAFRRFVVYEMKKSEYFSAHPSTRDPEALGQYFGEAYGISADYARELVHTIYLEEKPEDRKLLRIRWQKFGIGMEHLLLRLANPNATEERILELLRESIRAGKVTIAA